ncbi:TIGR02391 family protein [Cytobacillus solani]|uniref:TIGR02391 family protein n=1 Tax=Cytobacillus solani TaxID=1637975 RepID=UPI00207A8E24|nr:TIGR02391 family protein [Cytobacillus solani]USK56386.1 TIGR02391 family protein [Cytobacillus solani]
MDLKANIEHDLWEAIKKNYENESFSSSILDAIHLLTETIRNKTGLEGDGNSLIGQALGGSDPRLKINNLQTESEKNIQRGIQDILKGFYTAIRNPRSHDKFNDSKEEADSLIHFINYLLKMIDKSKRNFEESTFLRSVFDEYFVRTEEYSNLLVNEIPKRKRVDIAISIILQRKTGDISNLSCFFKILIDALEENEIYQVYKVISDQLKYASEEEEIRTILHIAPPKYWDKIDKVVRLRIEDMLLKDVRNGRYNRISKKCITGFLGTWIETEHLFNFENLSEWNGMFVLKLEGSDDEEKAYIEKYFLSKICEVNRDNIDFDFMLYIRVGLEENDEKIIELVRRQIQYDELHPWWDIFEEELKGLPQIEYVELPF